MSVTMLNQVNFQNFPALPKIFFPSPKRLNVHFGYFCGQERLDYLGSYEQKRHIKIIPALIILVYQPRYEAILVKMCGFAYTQKRMSFLCGSPSFELCLLMI
jgi:hypothetical protein